jgi:nucleotide-binding universal stress UspA family protein
MFNTILVPTDGSPGTDRVIDRASELAALNDAEMRFVYAANPSSYMGLPLETPWEGVETMLHEEGEKALRAAETRCSADQTDSEIIEGRPSREIVAYAERTSCDLIVMGTHGRGGLNRLLLGSVAERVVRSATVPVMTVRIGSDAQPEPELSKSRQVAADPSVSGALE